MITKLLIRFLNKSYEMDTLAYKWKNVLPYNNTIMEKEDIDFLLKEGWWIQVSPLANSGSGWVCGIYKRGKKTGNWVTEYTRTYKSPHACYKWARRVLEKELDI